MDPNHKLWNQQQQELRQALEHPQYYGRAINLFLDHHAMVHSARMSQTGLWSYEDEILEGLTNVDIRRIPPNEEHSIAWILWHLARIEDVTMNILVAGSPQIFCNEGWLSKLGFISRETGNALDKTGIVLLSTVINIDALRAYRISVGCRTREIVKNLLPVDIIQKVDPARLEKVFAEGAVLESTRWLIEYWGKKTIAELLLMPPTRHNFVHLNEAMRLKKLSRMLMPVESNPLAVN
jgi:hypothetical protein